MKITKEQRTTVKQALALMNSMIIGGEDYTEKSIKIFKNAMKIINELPISDNNTSKFVQSIANKTEYIDGGPYKNKYIDLEIPVIEYNELIELAAKYDKK